MDILILIAVLIVVSLLILVCVVKHMQAEEIKRFLVNDAKIPLSYFDISFLGACSVIPYDEVTHLSNRATYNNYSCEKFFNKDIRKMEFAIQCIKAKKKYKSRLQEIIANNATNDKDRVTGYKSITCEWVRTIASSIDDSAYFLLISYSSPKGQSTDSRTESISYDRLALQLKEIRQKKAIEAQREIDKMAKIEKKAQEERQKQEDIFTQHEKWSQYQQESLFLITLLLGDLENPDKEYDDDLPRVKPYDVLVEFNSRAKCNNYTSNKYFSEDETNLDNAELEICFKESRVNKLKEVLADKSKPVWKKYPKVTSEWVESLIQQVDLDTFIICARYTSPTGKSITNNLIKVPYAEIKQRMQDREDAEKLQTRRNEIKKKILETIRCVKDNKGKYIVAEDEARLVEIAEFLYSTADKDIDTLKSNDMTKWEYLDGIIDEARQLLDRNKKLFNYYRSSEFLTIKMLCGEMIQSQRDFNQYIEEKVKSIAEMFGKAEIRTETVSTDINDYNRPFQKTIDAFTMEVSAQVFSSAENSPLQYVVKYFYPDKAKYPNQIQQLQMLISELETLKEARVIIDKYKEQYKEHITNVPSYVMEYDKDGFYVKLGFADLSEKRLVVNYRFKYTSNGGYAQRSFTVPMTEETIAELINALQNKLTYTEFAKQQRSMMTAKLRQQIKARDNYTCCMCKNSTHKEPNLLLEVDHIVPIKRGGITEESNLQTLCWRCNRSKGAK